MNKIPNDWLLNSVEHRYGGNGWAVVQICEDNMCRLAHFFTDKEGRWHVGNQLFLAWQKLLKLEPEREQDQYKNWVYTGKNLTLPAEIVDKIKEIRAKLASGEWVVKNTRLVKVEPEALLI